MYLHALNAEKIDKAIAPKQGAFIEQVTKLERINKELDHLSKLVARYSLDKSALQDIGEHLKNQIKELKFIKMPLTAFVPIKRICSDQILHMKHKQGEFNFYLDTPDDCDYLKISASVGAPSLKLKRGYKKSDLFTKGKDHRTLVSGIKAGTEKILPTTQKLSRLFLKPTSQSKDRQDYHVDFYAHFHISHPTIDVPMHDDVDWALGNNRHYSQAIKKFGMQQVSSRRTDTQDEHHSKEKKPSSSSKSTPAKK